MVPQEFGWFKHEATAKTRSVVLLYGFSAAYSCCLPYIDIYSYRKLLQDK